MLGVQVDADQSRVSLNLLYVRFPVPCLTMIAKFDYLANSLELGTRKVLDMSWTVELKGKKLPEPFGLLQFFMSYIEIGQYLKY